MHRFPPVYLIRNAAPFFPLVTASRLIVRHSAVVSDLSGLTPALLQALLDQGALVRCESTPHPTRPGLLRLG